MYWDTCEIVVGKTTTINLSVINKISAYTINIKRKVIIKQNNHE